MLRLLGQKFSNALYANYSIPNVFKIPKPRTVTIQIRSFLAFINRLLLKSVLSKIFAIFSNVNDKGVK